MVCVMLNHLPRQHQHTLTYTHHTCTCTYTYTHTDITVLQGYVLQQESKLLPVLSSKLEANDNLSDYFHPNCCKLSVYLWVQLVEGHTLGIISGHMTSDQSDATKTLHTVHLSVQ